MYKSFQKAIKKQLVLFFSMYIRYYSTKIEQIKFITEDPNIDCSNYYEESYNVSFEDHSFILKLLVDRVKPWFMVNSLAHGSHGVFHNVLLEHDGGLLCISPFNVHFDFGHHCDTQWYLRLLSEPCNPTQTI